MVDPVRSATGEERERALAAAGLNLFPTYEAPVLRHFTARFERI